MSNLTKGIVVTLIALISLAGVITIQGISYSNDEIELKNLIEAQVDTRDANYDKAWTTIKKDRIHGIEIREDMFSIATTNMILRGDGKSNLIKNDFLKRDIKSMRANNYSVGLINPPYSQAKGKDTAHLSEIHFIEHLLDGLADNGRCVIIVPQSTMVGKTSEDKKSKKTHFNKTHFRRCDNA